MIELIFRLLIAHALTDFALQGNWVIDAKKRGYIYDQYPFPHWSFVLIAHALICGAGVWWATGSLFLGILEIVMHFLTDLVKCENMISPNQDQFIHLGHRALYVVFIWRPLFL